MPQRDDEKNKLNRQGNKNEESYEYNKVQMVSVVGKSLR